MDEDKKLLASILDETLHQVTLGFAPEALRILDDPNANLRDIERVRSMISPEIALHLVSLASSAYLGPMRRGHVASFHEAVMRLGSHFSKIFIIGYALTSLTQDQRTERIFAKNFATAILARFFAQRLNMSKQTVQDAEISGFMLETGKILIHLHERTTGNRLPEDFVEAHHWELTIAMAERFDLPAFVPSLLPVIFEHHRLDFSDEFLSLAGIVYLAHTVAADSFARHGRLVVGSPLPDSLGMVSFSPGKVIQAYFNAVSLEKYLTVIERPTAQQRLRRGTSG